MVDCASYLLNNLQERGVIKSKIAAPLFSLVSLAALALYSIIQGISEYNGPEVQIELVVMVVFPSLNLLVDAVNIFFWRERSQTESAGFGANMCSAYMHVLS